MYKGYAKEALKEFANKILAIGSRLNVLAGQMSDDVELEAQGNPANDLSDLATFVADLESSKSRKELAPEKVE